MHLFSESLSELLSPVGCSANFNELFICSVHYIAYFSFKSVSVCSCIKCVITSRNVIRAVTVPLNALSCFSTCCFFAFVVNSHTQFSLSFT